jgi:hypothetical protein
VPIDISFFLFDIVRKLSRRLADDFEITFSRHPTYLIGGELLKAVACQHLVDLCNGFKNIQQPVFAVGGIQNTSVRSSAIRSAMRGFSKSRIDIWV